MSNLTVSQRPLSTKEAERFSREIARTPNIVGYKPNELLKLATLLVIEHANEAVGMLAYVESTRYIDLKILLVLESERGKGYGKQLMNTALQHFDRTTKPIYAVTRNPIVINMLLRAGFAKTSFFKLPLSCQLHQMKMVFSVYRAKELLRKWRAFPNEPRFSYYIRTSATTKR